MNPYRYNLIMQEEKVMLCTCTDNIHKDGDDDHQHNSTVHSVKEVLTSSYQIKY
jgi:hypothetical protein